MTEAVAWRPVRREINLLERSLQPAAHRPWPAWWPWALGLGALLVCGVLSGVQSRETARLTQQLNAVRAQSSALSETPPPLSPEEEVRLRAEATQLQEQVLRLRGVQQAQAVSAVLDALAQATLDGVWLTRIRVDRDTGVLRLEGHTRSAKLIPEYLTALARQAPFAGMAVRKVGVKPRMASDNVTQDGFEFDLESEPIEGRALPAAAPAPGVS